MFAVILFINTIFFSPQVSLENAYQGPGMYYWRVDFGPGDLVQGATPINEEPADWQPIYDEHWQKVAPWAISAGYDAPHDGCWLTHTCPPLMVRKAEIEGAGPLEALARFLAFLLQWN